MAPSNGEPIKVNKNSRSGDKVTLNEVIQLPVDPLDGQSQLFTYRNGDKATYSYNESSDSWSLTVNLVNEKIQKLQFHLGLINNKTL